MWQFIVQMIAAKKQQNANAIAQAQSQMDRVERALPQDGASPQLETEPMPETTPQLTGSLKDSLSSIGKMGVDMGGKGPGPEMGGSDAPAVSAPPAANSIDVFGGEDFGASAKEATAKAEPAAGDYIQNAFSNYARNKVGKRIAGKLDTVADVTNWFGADNKTESGQKIQDFSDWLSGDTREKRDRRRSQGLYMQR